MSSPLPLITQDRALDLALLMHLQRPPEPFAPGSPRFWDDPHISAQLLATHLDPTIAAASRPPDEIARSVAWISDLLRLEAGGAVLDLGCGPGLYAVQFAVRGLRVTGIDYARRSIDYAAQYARDHQLEIAYRYEDYLTLDERQRYDVALLIYGDYCVLPPARRHNLLRAIHRALRPGGHFVLDVSTRLHRQRHGLRNGWYALDKGFWRPGPHLVLEQGFDYPDLSLYLDQYLVVEPDGGCTVYRNWFQDYTAEQISAELAADGFTIRSLWNDLAGTPLSTAGEWIGVVAQRA